MEQELPESEKELIRTETRGVWTIGIWSDGSKTFSIPESRIVRRFKTVLRNPAGEGLPCQQPPRRSDDKG